MAVVSMVSMKTREPDVSGQLKPGQKADGEIIRACQAGDDAAFSELVARYSGRAYWVALGLLANQEESRDVIQDAFLRVYRAIDRFDFNQNFYTWLYRIVVNLSIDRLRKLSKARSVAIDDVGEPAAPSSPEVSPGRGLEQTETAREVHEVLARLPEKYRAVMVLRELNGLSCKEIAGIVRSSHATVRWRLHMARKQFKDEWERREVRKERGGACHEL
ncbi:MAG: sigma-70 family RNA polymerase sigma factor [Planctomycetota bacterium]